MFRTQGFRKNVRQSLFFLVASGMLAPCGCLVFADDPPAAATPAAAGTVAPPDAIDGKTFRALLVGCTKYDNLKPTKWLNGPANDVDLVYRFFTDHLRLPPQSIVVLTEAEAAAHGETSRPTRANIGREIQKLIATAQSGDQVVLLLAGHGGQQPEQADPDPMYLKPDGLDQMFLPCDCGQWSGKKWCVENAIADHDLRRWCKQITAKKARLWVILDACCSGWTMMGAGEVVKRDVYSVDLGIPQAALDKSRMAAEARRPVNREGVSSRGADDNAPAFAFGAVSPDYVGIYAVQRDQPEWELPMPVDAEQGQPQRPQGLLTFAIIDVLSHASQPITYGELANLVRQRYLQWGEVGPTPVCEGMAQDRVVLGVKRWPGRSRRQWRKDGGKLTANEGSVEGLTPDSILALYPAIDQPNPETVLGYAKIKDCDLLESDIAPARYNDTSAVRSGALPDGGCFDVAFADFGSLRVKVGVDTQAVNTASLAAGSAADAAASAKLRKLADELKTALSADGSLCEFADDARIAQWVVQMRDGKLNLLSKNASLIRGKFPPDVLRFRVADDHPVADIVDEMSKIARAQNLLALTKADNAGGAAADDSSQPNVELKIMQYKTKSDRQGREVDLAKEQLVLVPGDYVGWRMTNQGKSDVAVSLLYIDAGFGIHAIFPRPNSGVENILTKNGGALATKHFKITADPVGNEHVVLIAVPRQEGRQAPDFSFLEQPTLPQARGNGEDNPGLNSPLGRLLKNAMYGKGGTRGLDSGDAAEAHLMLQSWRTSADSGQSGS